jgi:hypothetical protein
MTQPSIIDAIDSHVTAPAEQTRLSGQNARILARLEHGDMTRDEIAAIGRNVTARVSDLRAYLKPQGRNVKCVEHNRKTGFTRYGIRAL